MPKLAYPFRTAKEPVANLPHLIGRLKVSVPLVLILRTVYSVPFKGSVARLPPSYEFRTFNNQIINLDSNYWGLKQTEIDIPNLFVKSVCRCNRGAEFGTTDRIKQAHAGFGVSYNTKKSMWRIRHNLIEFPKWEGTYCIVPKSGGQGVPD
jgi:hypothetical protein